jgi:hypothetical protein
VKSKRGRYYDWLNIVHALGGFDIREAEGRVPLEVGLATENVRDATRLYLALANSDAVKLWDRFDEQIRNFALSQFAMYVAWTDSFKFHWDEENRHVSAVTPVPIPGGPTDAPTDKQSFDIRFGQLPRDMRHARTLVVDGWVMTFPRKRREGGSEAKFRQNGSFDFADYFLSPERQLTFLRQGFPTSSLPVIRQEVEDLETRRARDRAAFQRPDQCYEIFLQTLQTAITSGVPVPSLSHEVSSSIVELLNPILTGKWEGEKTARELENIGTILRAHELGQGRAPKEAVHPDRVTGE